MPTPQAPLSSGFDAFSTTDDVVRGIDLSGRVAIVTGGYSGLGAETVRGLISAGARVIVPARDVARAREALRHLPGAEIEPMDLLDPASIDTFAARHTGEPLHLLVNNAGIMAVPTLTRDARGYEVQFATNHLGHFQLTRRLWPALVRAGGARVISLSSRGHRFSPVHLDDLNFEHRPYDPWLGYGQSKTANILFAVALDRRGAANGIRAFSVHPGGIVDTNLGKHVPKETLVKAGAIDAEGHPIINPEIGFKNLTQGAATQVWCATSPQLNGLGGVYCEDCDIAPVIPEETTGATPLGPSRSAPGVRAYATDPATAERLLDVSERLLEV